MGGIAAYPQRKGSANAKDDRRLQRLRASLEAREKKPGSRLMR
jgi:hypothetical protein